MLQTLIASLTIRGRSRNLSVCLLCAFSWLTVACAKCPESPRPRDEALKLATQFSLDSFRANSNRTLVPSELKIVDERYQKTDHAWYFQIASTDNQCLIDIAVPDCEGTESTGGGECTRT